MPEVIEVKTYTDFIRDKILNKTLQDIEIQNGRYKRKGPFEHYKELLNSLPLKFKAVESKGKFMYLFSTVIALHRTSHLRQKQFCN